MLSLYIRSRRDVSAHRRRSFLLLSPSSSSSSSAATSRPKAIGAVRRSSKEVLGWRRLRHARVPRKWIGGFTNSPLFTRAARIRLVFSRRPGAFDSVFKFTFYVRTSHPRTFQYFIFQLNKSRFSFLVT